MSNQEVQQRVAFAFLEDIMSTWRADFAAVEQTAIAFSMNEKFSPILAKKLVGLQFDITITPQ